MINVLYDNQVFTWQKSGGISRYFVELMDNLESDISPKLSIYISENIYLNHDNSFLGRKLLNFKFIGKNKVFSCINNLMTIRELSKNKFDIFHPTYFDSYFINKIHGKPFVITIHDMIPENFPQYFKNSKKLIEDKRKMAEECTKIVAISNSTKAEILKHYTNVSEDKIEVIYHGSNFNYSPIVSKTMQLPSKYVLFVGVRNDYKNFINFFYAFEKLAIANDDIYLICTGNPFSHSEILMFTKSNLLERVLRFFVSDVELKELYTRALFFIFPSYEEGFGLPILEAMTSNCLLLLSDIACFKEIAQDAAIYFDPYDVDSIYAQMNIAINDVSVRMSKVKLGNVRANDFSWKKSGEELSNLYKLLS